MMIRMRSTPNDAAPTRAATPAAAERHDEPRAVQLALMGD
jgi:hypothetical protein